MKTIILPCVILGLVGAANAHESEAETAAAPKENKLVPAGEGRDVENPFHPIKLLLSNAESEGGVTIYKFILPPKSPGSPPHIHTREDEYFYVLAGYLDVLLDGEVRRLGPGDFAALNRGHTHMFWNGSDEQTELLMTTTGASFEAFMREAAPRLAEAKPLSPEAAGAVIGQLAAEHGITISMEKMPEAAASLYAPPTQAD